MGFSQLELVENEFQLELTRVQLVLSQLELRLWFTIAFRPLADYNFDPNVFLKNQTLDYVKTFNYCTCSGFKTSVFDSANDQICAGAYESLTNNKDQVFYDFSSEFCGLTNTSSISSQPCFMDTNSFANSCQFDLLVNQTENHSVVNTYQNSLVYAPKIHSVLDSNIRNWNIYDAAVDSNQQSGIFASCKAHEKLANCRCLGDRCSGTVMYGSSCYGLLHDHEIEDNIVQYYNSADLDNSDTDHKFNKSLSDSLEIMKTQYQIQEMKRANQGIRLISDCYSYPYSLSDLQSTKHHNFTILHHFDIQVRLTREKLKNSQNSFNQVVFDSKNYYDLKCPPGYELLSCSNSISNSSLLDLSPIQRNKLRMPPPYNQNNLRPGCLILSGSDSPEISPTSDNDIISMTCHLYQQYENNCQEISEFSIFGQSVDIPCESDNQFNTLPITYLFIANGPVKIIFKNVSIDSFSLVGSGRRFTISEESLNNSTGVEEQNFEPLDLATMTFDEIFDSQKIVNSLQMIRTDEWQLSFFLKFSKATIQNSLYSKYKFYYHYFDLHLTDQSYLNIYNNQQMTDDPKFTILDHSLELAVKNSTLFLKMPSIYTKINAEYYQFVPLAYKISSEKDSGSQYDYLKSQDLIRVGADELWFGGFYCVLLKFTFKIF